MKLKEKVVIFCLLFLIVAFFFYKFFVFGKMPIPGDLLISEYNPWKSYSFLGYAPGGFPNKAQYFDVIRQLYPWKTLSINLLKAGEIPLWNPYNFSGAPLLANFQSAIFYPFNILYLFFPQIDVWTILIIIQPLLAAYFTYLYSRRIGLEKTGAFLSAISFSFSLFMTVFLQYGIIGNTFLWLPLILYSIESSLKKVNYKSILLFVFGMLFSAFAGHVQIFGFVFVFILAYIVFRIFNINWNKNKKQKFLLLFLVLFILIFGIFSIQLFPTLELIKYSARSNQSFQFLIEKLLIQPQQLMLFLSPDFWGNPATKNYLINDTYPGNAIYIGLIPFILAMFSFVLSKKNYFVKFFIFSSIALLLLFVRTPFSEIFYSIKIPFFSTGSPTNAIFLLSFCLSVLSGFGLESWLVKNGKKNIYIYLSLFSIFIFILFLILVLKINVSIRNFYFSIIIFVAFSVIFWFSNFWNKRKIASFLFIIITIFELFYFFHKFNPFTPRELIFPNTEVFNFLIKKSGIDRFWGYGNATVDSNFATQYKLFSPDGYDPLYPRIYGEFIQSSNDGKINKNFNNHNRSDAVLASGFGEENLSSNFYRLKVMDMLGVKYILDKVNNASTEKTFPEERFKKIYDRDGWYVFENIQASPRFFLTSNYKVYQNINDFENIFFSKDFNPSKTVLLEEKLNITLGNLDAKASLVSYSPNKIVIKTETKDKKLLFLSDTYFPGWKASVDGDETKIFRANYAFRSVVVPEGNHAVIFEYKPESFYLGMKVSIISVIVLFGFIFIQSRVIRYNEK